MKKSNLFLLSLSGLLLFGCNESSSQSSSEYIASQSETTSSSEVISSSQASSESEQSSSSKSEESSSSSSVKPIESYTLSLANSPSLAKTNSYFTERIKYYDSKTLSFEYNGVSSSTEGHIKINNGGSIKNLSPLDGFTQVEISYTGNDLEFNYGITTAEANTSTYTSGAKSKSFDDSFRYFEIKADGEVEILSIKFYLSFEYKTNYSYVEVFDNDYNKLKVIEGEIGSTISLDNLPVPGPNYYEDKVIQFLGYGEEDYNVVIDNFTFTKDSKALYPVYENVIRYSFDHDFVNHTYTSFKKGVRPVSEVPQEKYGRFSADFEIINQSCTSADLIFNATMGPNSYPYEIGDGTTYYALHMNPNSGGFQFACDYAGPSVSGWNVLASASTSTNIAWYKKWSAWNNGRETNLKFNFKAEFTPDAILLYIDDGLLMTYVKPEGLNLLDATGVGIRANTGGVVCSNFKFDKYVETVNGFLHFDDGSYVSYLSNVSTVTNVEGGTYGLFESEMLISSTSTNSRSGIMARCAHTGDTSDWASTSGYYVHHNVTGNGNFTMSTIAEGTYQGIPGNANNGQNIGGTAYTETTGPEVLQSYWALNNAFYKTNTESTLKLKISLDVKDDALRILINDVEIYSTTNTTALDYFKAQGYTGLGVLAGTPGVRFMNMRWTSYEK